MDVACGRITKSRPLTAEGKAAWAGRCLASPSLLPLRLDAWEDAEDEMDMRCGWLPDQASLLPPLGAAEGSPESAARSTAGARGWC